MYRYVHDEERRIVYKFRAEPDVSEKTDRRGRRTDWYVRLEIEITRADNKLLRNQWQHRTSDYPDQYLGAQYTREQAVSYFMSRHTPKGAEIDESEYDRLQAEYEAEARSR